MKSVKKIAITLVGGVLVLLGIALIILPGPAFLLIPLGLAVLALEYPQAKSWLRWSQRKMSQGAEWLDNWVRKIRR